MTQVIDSYAVETSQRDDYITQAETDAERTVLAAMLANARHRHTVRGRITGDMFATGWHRDVHEAINDADQRGELGSGGVAYAAVPSVIAALERTAKRPATGEVTGRVTAIAECAPYSDGQLDKAISRTEEAHARRAMRASGLSLVQASESAHGRDLEELRDIAARATANLAEATTPKGSEGQSVTDEWAEFLDDIVNGDPGIVRTGYLDLDPLVTIERGNVVVLGARTSIGKSAMGLNLARRMAAMQPDSVRVTYLSYEMSRKQCRTRLVAAVAGVSPKQIKTNELSDRDWARVRGAGRQLPSNLYVPDAPSRRLETALATIYREAAIAESESRAAVVFLDYVQQLIPGAVRFSNERERLTYVSNMIQQAAQESGAVVIELAQLNRDADDRAGHRPELSDIYGSGAFEHDAHCTILLYRPDFYDRDDPRVGEIDLIVAKQRDGATGTVTLAHQLRCQRIVDMATGEEPDTMGSSDGATVTPISRSQMSPEDRVAGGFPTLN